MGRERVIKWGPRIIDIDILFYENKVIQQENLIIPHPELHRRYFVLRPLMELCPDFIHPILRKSISSLYSMLREELSE
jgi:2-amino-4-hydroxy-6-hydroxymethyldihydropteridine diphosphokinase